MPCVIRGSWWASSPSTTWPSPSPSPSTLPSAAGRYVYASPHAAAIYGKIPHFAGQMESPTGSVIQAVQVFELYQTGAYTEPSVKVVSYRRDMCVMDGCQGPMMREYVSDRTYYLTDGLLYLSAEQVRTHRRWRPPQYDLLSKAAVVSVSGLPKQQLLALSVSLTVLLMCQAWDREVMHRGLFNLYYASIQVNAHDVGVRGLLHMTSVFATDRATDRYIPLTVMWPLLLVGGSGTCTSSSRSCWVCPMLTVTEPLRVAVTRAVESVHLLRRRGWPALDAIPAGTPPPRRAAAGRLAVGEDLPRIAAVGESGIAQSRPLTGRRSQ